MKVLPIFALLLFLFAVNSCSEREKNETEEQFFAASEEDLTLEDSIQILNEKLKDSPQDMELLLAMGNLCKEALNFRCALDAGAKAYKLDSTNLEARKLYAWTLINKPKAPLSDIERAKRHYRYVLSLKPNSPSAMVELANTHSLTGDFKTAIKLINDALKIDDQYRDAYVLKGSIYKTIENYDLALSSYQTAVQLDPDYFIGHLNIGWLLSDMGKHDLALEYYENAHELKSENLNAIYGAAKSYQDLEKYDKALQGYRDLLKVDSTFYISYFNQAYIKQHHQHQLDSAVHFYNELLSINPDYVQGWYQLGKTYYEQGRQSDAARAYSKALKIDENYTPAKEAAQELKENL